MSEVYALEPVTSGRVVLTTTLGPIEIDLWAKECPNACRNFVQLCLEHYYDGTLFNRVIKGFLVQTGEPASGDESTTFGPDGFKREFHSRLKYRYRGLLGVASRENGMGSNHFFITLEPASGLNGRHTLFGKVTGPTLWNVTRIGEVEVDPDDRPLDPPRILGAEVEVNPFPDIVPRALYLPKPVVPTPEEILAEQLAEERRKAGERPLLKGSARKALLSFGDEEEDEAVWESERTVKSAHDVLGPGSGLSSREVATPEVVAGTKEKIEVVKAKIAATAKGLVVSDATNEPSETKRASNNSDEEEPKTDTIMGTEVRKERLGMRTTRDEGGTQQRADLERMAVQDADLLTEQQRKREVIKAKKQSQSRREREAAGVARLASFRKRLRTADSTKHDWLNTDGLKFAVDSSTAYAYDAARDALAVYDPLAKSGAAFSGSRKKERAHEGQPRDIEPW